MTCGREVVGWGYGVKNTPPPMPVERVKMKKCRHTRDEVRCGAFRVCAGGAMHLREQDFSNLDVVIRLTASYEHPSIYPDVVEVISFPIPDFQVPGEGWAELIHEVIGRLESGQKVLVHCMGGHGRTGLFLASIIAKLEPDVENPVVVMRERYCQKAIETREQEACIFRFAGK